MAEEELLKYGLTDLILRNNGAVVLIAEQLFEQSFDTYNNLIITCFDSTGQVNWNQVVQNIRILMCVTCCSMRLKLMNTVKWLWRPGP